MKRSYLSLVIFLLMFSSNLYSSLLTNEEKLYLEKYQPEILFGYVSPPNAFYDKKGEYKGLLIDYQRELETKLEYKFAYRHFDKWSELIEYAKKAKNFVVVGIAQTENRNNYLTFTSDFISIPYVIVVNKNSNINSFVDILDKQICTVEKYAVNSFLKKNYPEMELNHVPDNLEGLKNIASNNYDAMIINQMYATKIIEKQGLMNLKIIGTSGYNNKLRVGVPLKEVTLKKIMQKGIDSITERRRNEMYRKWISVYKSRPFYVSKIFYLLIFLITILILLVIYFWKKFKVQTKEVYKKNQKYKKLFYDSPIPLWEEDFTLVKKYLDKQSKKCDDLNAFFDENPQEIHKCSKLVKIIDVNNAAIKLHEAKSKEELLGDLSKLFTSNSILAFKKELLAIYNNDLSIEVEGEIKTLNGILKNVLINMSLLNISNGNYTAIISTTDITKRKKILYNLKKSQQTAHIGSYIWNLKTQEVEWSNEMYRILGISKNDFRPNFEEFTELIHKDDLTHFNRKNISKKLCQPTHNIEFRVIDQSTKKIKHIHLWGETTYDTNGDPISVFGTMQDISELKKAEKTLIENENRYKALFQDSYSIMLIIDPQNGKIINANNSAVNYYGYSYEKLTSMNIDELNLFSDKEVKDEIQNAILEKRNHFFFKHKLSNNEIRDVEVYSSKIQYSGKTVLYSIIYDVTDKKRNEADLNKLSTAVSQSTSIIVITDLAGNSVYVNPQFINTTGYSENFVIGKNLKLLQSGHHSKDFYDNLWSTLKSGKTWKGEFYNRKKSGDLFWESASISPIFDSSKKLINYVKVAEDITEKKKNEVELRKIEKLRSIGTLAGGIAHDFNNLLTAIYGNISLSLLSINDKHPSYEYLKECENSIGRATKLTNQLLTFSKGGNPVKQQIDLTKIIHDIISFDLSGSNLKPLFDFPKKPVYLFADEGQIQQVFSNLTINAIEASPAGGHLSVSIEELEILETEIIDFIPGVYIKIIVKDEGLGIPIDILDKIFDPYFTTKKTGNGLGLATTYSIVKNHKGFLDIKSEINKGTTFTIYLPSINETTTSKTKQEHQENEAKNLNSVKILVMDDEKSIRVLLSSMLTILGHKVVTVSNGDEAIEEYNKTFPKNNPFDLLIMDLTIPGGMGGKEATKRILEINPNAKVIVSSGYSSSDGVSSYKNHGFVNKIDKPYTMNALKQVIAKTLGT